MTNLTATAMLSGILLAGIGVGAGAVAYSFSAQVTCSLPSQTAAISNPEFFKETQHFSTTGGKSW